MCIRDRVRDGDGALDLYHGKLRALDAAGVPIFDMLDYTCLLYTSRCV